ncbi:hypothetical protein FOA52_001777 [Chlamydomonas sp. UWO 241]|nr:hypothetical protein FOA52_001777 [Chlamydomonas sp. UWO 241]
METKDFVLYHLSDVHIKAGDRAASRYDEYIAVFERLFESIASDVTSDAKIAVITGDVFHDKTRIDASGIELFYKLVRGLLTVCTLVYIIRGNHDYKQWKRPQDMEPFIIDSLLSGSAMDRVHFLDATATVSVPGTRLSFGVLAIQDVLAPGATSAQIKRPDPVAPPLPSSEIGSINALLFHGAPPTTRMLRGFDCALLGDQHLQKVWTDTGSGCVCGFAGSLIAQNASEDGYAHGYLRWTFRDRQAEATAVVLDNPARRTEAEPGRRRALDLSDALPKPPSNSPTDWADYVTVDDEPLRRRLVLTPELALLPDFPADQNQRISEKVAERNKKIDAKLATYLASLNGSGSSGNSGSMGNPRNRCNLLYMKWSWLFCFGAANHFDFGKHAEDGGSGGVACIGWGNATGKTSFIETICVALYGTGFPSRTTRTNTASIINGAKPARDKACVTLTLSIQDVRSGQMRMYRVYRAFSTQSAASTSLYPVSRSTGVDEFSEAHGGWVTVHTGKVALDGWVAEHVAPMELLLMTNLVSQNSDMDFFNMSHADQKAVLDGAVGMRPLTLLTDVLHEAVLASSYVADMAAAARPIADPTTSESAGELTDCQERLARLLETQTSVPAYVPSSADLLLPKQVYRDAKVLGPAVAEAKRAFPNLAPATNPSINPSSTDGSSTVDDLVEAWNRTYPKYVSIPHTEEPVTAIDDCGPTNPECACCMAWLALATDARKDRDDFLRHCRDVRDETRSLAQRLVVVGGPACAAGAAGANAEYMHDAYDDIVLELEISALRQRVKALAPREQQQRQHRHVYAEYIDAIKAHIKLVSGVLQSLSGYERVFFDSHVLPHIQKTVNTLVGAIDDTTAMSAPVFGAKRIEWTLANGVPIERASGFQRFMCGIAARLAMLAFSRSGATLTQLFIDEGFNVCDVAHIARVPSFLSAVREAFALTTVFVCEGCRCCHGPRDAWDARMPFHPIGKLSRMTLSFRRKDGSLYNFKGVDHTILVAIKYYAPKAVLRLPRSSLNAAYDPDVLKYQMNNDKEKKAVERARGGSRLKMADVITGHERASVAAHASNDE